MPSRRFVNWFLGSTAGALVASIFYPVFRFLSPPEIPESTTNQVEAGPTNNPELVEKGFKIVRFGNDPVLLVRAGEDDYRAFAATCTHLDCIVEYQKDQEPHLVQLPQRRVQPERDSRGGAATQASRELQSRCGVAGQRWREIHRRFSDLGP